MIGFGPCSAVDRADPRRLSVGLPLLGGGKDTVELWRSQEPLQRGEAGGLYFSKNDELLFASWLAHESSYPDFESASYDLYRRILSLIETQGYPHLLRVWHYFPGINSEPGGLERYQAFCLGRYRALQGIPDFEHRLPAACAIGTSSPGFLVYFLSAKEAGLQVENPRQLSAFRYPRRYGPQSPSFSRAILKRWENVNHLYISGTSSIVGHETRHLDDTFAQLEETLNNLDALVTEANRSMVGPPVCFSLLKAYLREAADPTAIRARIAQRLGEDIPLLLLRGDTCRRNLLVEIEGLSMSAPGSPARRLQLSP
ncbi:MAG: hypothetical protein ACREV4_04185 [Gammaproteobacteria bacterium]